jgi:hypothetical protein
MRAARSRGSRRTRGAKVPAASGCVPTREVKGPPEGGAWALLQADPVRLPDVLARGVLVYLDLGDPRDAPLFRGAPEGMDRQWRDAARFRVHRLRVGQRLPAVVRRLFDAAAPPSAGSDEASVRKASDVANAALDLHVRCTTIGRGDRCCLHSLDDEPAYCETSEPYDQQALLVRPGVPLLAAHDEANPVRWAVWASFGYTSRPPSPSDPTTQQPAAVVTDTDASDAVYAFWAVDGYLRRVANGAANGAASRYLLAYTSSGVAFDLDVWACSRTRALATQDFARDAWPGAMRHNEHGPTQHARLREHGPAPHARVVTDMDDLDEAVWCLGTRDPFVVHTWALYGLPLRKRDWERVRAWQCEYTDATGLPPAERETCAYVRAYANALVKDEPPHPMWK